MADNYLDIEKALIAAYRAVDSITPCGYPNAPLADSDKPDGLWVQLHNLRAASNPVTIGYTGEDDHPGFMQVDFNYPENRGTGAIYAKADILATAFPAGRSIENNGQYVHIWKTSLSHGRVVGGYYRVNLDIYYYARTTRG